MREQPLDKHVFISYQHDDFEFAYNMLYKLKYEYKDFKVWVDDDQLRPGEDWRANIDQAINEAFALIVIMTPEAKTSEYVTYEWAFAWGAGVPVIPIMYRKTELHPRLESLQYLDFTGRARPWEKLIDRLKEVAISHNSSNAPRKTKEQQQAEAHQLEIQELRTQLQEARQQATAHQHKIQELQAQLQEAQLQAEAQLQEAQLQAEVKQREIQELQAQLQEAQLQAEAKQREIQELQAQLQEAQLQAEIQDAQAHQLEIQGLQAQLQEAQQLAEAKQLEIQGLQAQLQEAQRQAEAQLQEAQQLADARQLEIQQLEMQLQEARQLAETDNEDPAPTVEAFGVQEAIYMKLTAANKTDPGKRPEPNEDSVCQRIEPSDEGDRGLFIVADGMGGHSDGGVASKLAVETISNAMDNFLKALPDQQQKTVKLPETPISISIEDRLTTAIQQAHNAILHYGEHKTADDILKPGCTVTAVLIHKDQAYIANVGDSRVYLLRDGTFTQITRDHSLVAKLVEAKQIKPEDVYTHPQRNQIYRSLGSRHKTIKIDLFPQTLRPGDTFLLCSDGLWEMVRDEDLLNELSKKMNPQQICDNLIDLANANGGDDDISAVVIHVSILGGS